PARPGRSPGRRAAGEDRAGRGGRRLSRRTDTGDNRITKPRPRWTRHSRTRPSRKEYRPIMAKLSTEELLDAFKEMTLIELSEFVKEFEETFDVKAAAPVAVGAGAGAPAAGAGEAPHAEGKDECDVV